MSRLHVLVVEDHANWRFVLMKLLGQLGTDVQIDAADNFEAAVEKVHDRSYDLVTVDLSLGGRDGTEEAPIDALGIALMDEIRTREREPSCGIVVLTAHSSTLQVVTSILQYGADNVVDKGQFNERAFLTIARMALLHTRVREAGRRAETSYRLVISVGEENVLRSELRGPGTYTVYTASQPKPLSTAELAHRADQLNSLILDGGPEAWRPDARKIGDDLLRQLGADTRLVTDLASARQLARSARDLHLQLEGPTGGLGVPFELLRVDSEYLVFHHVLSRRLTHAVAGAAHKPEPFHVFLKRLGERDDALGVLVIGANVDKTIPAAEIEAKAVADQIRADAGELGVRCQIDVLQGEQATHAAVSEALHNSRLHIVHYAGHGRFHDRLPEISGLVLTDGASHRSLTASDLKILLAPTDVRLVFLSCCFGGRTALDTGRGDVAGMLDALGQAGVPYVLSYRWSVADEPAKALALEFYRGLFKTLSPGAALLGARRSAALQPGGLDDDTWAAPILLEQAS